MSRKKGGNKRDDSYFAAERRRNKNVRILLIGVGIGVVVAGVAAALAYQNINSGPFVYGSAHEHAGFAVILGDQKIDFSQSQYQVQSDFIHVEGRDGTTLHRHAEGVPFGFFLESVGMSIQGDCFIRDDGEQFCSDGSSQLRFFINGSEVGSINDYVLEEEDRFLVIYGNQTDEEIQQEIELLDNMPLLK